MQEREPRPTYSATGSRSLFLHIIIYYMPSVVAVFFIGLSAIQTERLEWQTEDRRRRAKEFGSWEAAYFVTLARTFGMGVNGDLMEQWAKSLPMSVIEQRADDLFQLEALFLGQAGLLE